MGIIETLKCEQAVRRVLDSGGRYSQKDIENQLSDFRSDQIAAALRKLISGKQYDVHGGTYGLPDQN